MMEGGNIKPSWRWWLLPILLGIPGGMIAVVLGRKKFDSPVDMCFMTIGYLSTGFSILIGVLC